MIEYMIAFAIILFSATVQGATGFGFSLLAVPLLAFVLPLSVIVPVLVLFSLVLNVIVFFKLKGHVDKIQMFLLILFGLVSIPIGINALQGLDENIIKLVVGGVVIISAAAMQFGFKIKFKNQKIAYGLTGFFSGILNGSSSLSGPPVILMLSNEAVDKSTFRKTLATYFLTLNLFSIPMFILRGMVTDEVITNTLKLSPALLIGVLLGVGLGNKLPEAIFRKITLLLIFVMGVLTVISAI